MANKTKFSWKHDGKNTDGSAIDPALFAGWLLKVNGEATMSVPRGWETDGVYEVPFSEMGLFQVTGDYTISLQLTAKNGESSAFSDPVSFSQDFRKPTAPTGLSVG